MTEHLRLGVNIDHVATVRNARAQAKDQRDRLLGWYLPEAELGVDLRAWRP